MRTLYTKVVGTDGGVTTNYKQIAGLSSEDKPTDGLATGSCFIEVDTCLVAFYDEDNSEWHGGTVVDDSDADSDASNSVVNPDTRNLEVKEEVIEEPVVVKKTTRKKSAENG